MRRLDNFQEKNDTVIIAGPGNITGQTFISNKNNLSGIRIFIFNPKLGGKEEYKIKIISGKSQTIREEKVTESNLGWGQLFRYDFDPVSNSKNKTYKIEVEYAGSANINKDDLIKLNIDLKNGKIGESVNPETRNKLQKNYPGIAYSYTDEYKNGSAYLNNEKLNGDFVFQTYYSVKPAEFLSDTISGLRLKFAGDPYFILFYFLVIAGLSALVTRRNQTG